MITSKTLIILISSFTGLLLGFLSYFLILGIIGNNPYQITEELISAAAGLFISIFAGVTIGNFLERRLKK